MSKPRSGYSQSAALALRFHFLLEALRLDLLASPLAESVGRLAAAAEEGRGVRQRLGAVRALFLDAREKLGLEDLGWPEVSERSAERLAADALRLCEGEARPRKAAERLGWFCQELANRRKDRKASGSYYTPRWAADLIAETVVRGVLEGRGAEAKAALALKVLDPSVGAGAFATAAIEAIARAAGEGEAENEARRAAALECVFGIEVNPLAAEVCRLAVWLAASRPGRLAPMPQDHVVVGDALGQPPRRGSFDVVVGNPPWGVKLDARQAARLRESAPEALSGHRDSYVFFLNLAAESAREDGGLGMLLPDAVLSQVRYEGVRVALLARFRPVRVMLLGERIFPGATAPACVLCMAGGAATRGKFVTADLRQVGRAELGEAARESGWLVECGAPAQAPHHSFLVAPGWMRELMERMREEHPTLGELAEVFRFHDVGVNYGCAEAGRAILYYGQQEDRRDIPVVRGRDFGALTGIGHSAWLRHDWRARVKAGDRVSVREQVYRRAPKLVLRQTGDRPVATIDRRGVWFGRSVIAVTASKERELLWLASVLNSKAFAALYRAVAPEAGRPFAQVKVSKLKALPVPRVVDDRVAELARALLEEGDVGRRGELMEEIEEVVAGAYGLAAKERHLVGEAVTGGGSGRRSRRARHEGTSSARRPA